PVRLLREHLAEGVIELVRHSGDPVRHLQPHYPASPIPATRSLHAAIQLDRRNNPRQRQLL
ncbi:hypothetical protein, partial [Mesorhizobium sp. A623]